MSDGTFKILGICGSLRQNSYNRGRLRAAQELAPAPVVFDLYDGLATIPPFNQDVEAQGNLTDETARGLIKQQIEALLRWAQQVKLQE